MYSVRVLPIRRDETLSFIRGFIVYDEDDTHPNVTLPKDIPLTCQQSNPYYQTKSSVATDSLFVRTSDYNEEIFSDMFESIHVPESKDTRSTKSQSINRSYYSSSKNYKNS